MNSLIILFHFDIIFTIIVIVISMKIEFNIQFLYISKQLHLMIWNGINLIGAQKIWIKEVT